MNRKLQIALLLTSITCLIPLVTEAEETVQATIIDKTVTENLNQLIQNWNDAHTNKDVLAFSNLFDENVIFYTINKDKKSILEIKKNLFKKYPDFQQNIHGAINSENLADGSVKTTFTKRVIIKEKITDYPSYLIFKRFVNGWKIINEGDFVTDENLSKKNYISDAVTESVCFNTNTSDGKICLYEDPKLISSPIKSKNWGNAGAEEENLSNIKRPELRLISKEGKVLDLKKYKSPFAKLEIANINANQDTIFLLTTDDSEAMGSYTGLTTHPFIVKNSKISFIQINDRKNTVELNLISSLKNAWKTTSDGFVKIKCKPKSDGEFEIVLSRIQYQNNTWILSEKHKDGFWEFEDDSSFPDISEFPNSGNNDSTIAQQTYIPKQSPVKTKQSDLTLTPDQLIAAEHGNKARFLRDIVGKKVKVTGRVKNINDGFFNFEAAGSFAGWTVYIHDNNYLANLDAGKVVTINCRIEDMPLIGGVSKCD